MNHSCFQGPGLQAVYDDIMDDFTHRSEYQASQFGKTIEIMNCFIQIDDPRRRFITAPQRKHSLPYIIGELVWYLSGERTPDRIGHYSKFWNHLQDEAGQVNSNYGYKIFKKKFLSFKQGRAKTQMEFVVDELLRDPNSRRAVMLPFLSNEDYNQMHETKDYPCTMYLHFIIRDGKLDLIVHMRSNDFIYGFTNDMPFFSMLQEIVSVLIGVPMGHYYHFSDSMHLYERNWDLLNSDRTDGDPELETPFPPMTKEDVAPMPFVYPLIETNIREGKGQYTPTIFNWQDGPPFTKFVFQTLVNYWELKGEIL